MKPEYEIGQELWEIRERRKHMGDCERCGHQMYSQAIWYVDSAKLTIDSICYSHPKGVRYAVRQNCAYRELLPESDIGEIYFTTGEAAIAECERRNAEMRGE